MDGMAGNYEIIDKLTAADRAAEEAALPHPGFEKFGDFSGGRWGPPEERGWAKERAGPGPDEAAGEGIGVEDIE